MTSKPLGYWDYLKAAFNYKPRVPLLGRIPINPLALATFAVLGLANAGFLFLGAALEAGYLLALSSNRRFQNFVEAERLQESKARYEASLKSTVDRLSQPSRERYYRLLAQCRDALGVAAAVEGGSIESVQSLRTGSLNQLLSIFLRLLVSREALEQNVGRIERDALESHVSRLEKDLEGAAQDSQLYRSLEGSLEIQRKRLENFDKAQLSLRVIDAELDRIEQQVILIREEAAVGRKAESLSSHLDSVTTTLHETNRWMDQHSELIGELSPASTEPVPAVLPDLAPELEPEGR